MRNTILLFTLFLLQTSLFAQCENCLPVENTDECFTHAAFSDYCARFKKGSNHLYFQNAKKKINKFSLNNSQDANYWLRLAENNKLKPQELLFLQEAVRFWQNKYPAAEVLKTETSGLAWRIVQEGKGEKAQAGETVKLHYRLMDSQKRVVDQTFQPFEVVLEKTTIIQGIQEALFLARKGSVLWLKIPSNLAFGSKPYGNLPPDSDLLCELEILNE